MYDLEDSPSRQKQVYNWARILRNKGFIGLDPILVNRPMDELKSI